MACRKKLSTFLYPKYLQKGNQDNNITTTNRAEIERPNITVQETPNFSNNINCIRNYYYSVYI